MFDKDRILTCGESIVGWREDENAIYDTLSDELKASTSGIYFNDLPGVNFEIISAALSNDETDAATYLSNVYEGELLKIVNVFVERMKGSMKAKELLANKNLVSGVAKFKDKVTQNARFVGYLIQPRESNNLQTAITYLGFQATETQATPLKIYLYETSQKDAIATFDFPMTSEFSLTWQAISDFIVNYQSLNGGTGQVFLLGYYEKDPDNAQDFQLQSQALRMDFDCGCASSPKRVWNKYVGVWPIEINNEDLNWDGSAYTIPTPDEYFNNITEHTYGLLAKVNVTCDITELICSNISMFAEALQHGVAVRILLDAYSSNQINSVTDSNKADYQKFAMHYKNILNGYHNEDGKYIKGLIHLLNMDFSGLDKHCAPCSPREVKFGHIVR